MNSTVATPGRILIGTASWADKSLIDSGRFYPADVKTPEARLQHYAATFPIVEVDSSYYAMPAERVTGLWVDRTPAGFTFDVKSFALFTHHPTPPRSLPRDVREALPAELQAKRHLYYKDVPPEIRQALWQRFASALLPLDSAGKLGVVLFQFPPWFLPGRESRDFIAGLRQQLPQYTPAVEFRNPLWLDDEHQERTLAMLRDLQLPFVCVDEPQGTRASVPPIVAATAPVGIVRFHGRNQAAWAARNVSVQDKYNYEYSDAELQTWLPGIEQLASQTNEVHALLNNCVEDKGIRNAQDLARLLREVPNDAPVANGAPVPAPAGSTPPQPRLL
jgi:uncharacterized protein YecE (DUF72 family)